MKNSSRIIDRANLSIARLREILEASPYPSNEGMPIHEAYQKVKEKYPDISWNSVEGIKALIPSGRLGRAGIWYQKGRLVIKE